MNVLVALSGGLDSAVVLASLIKEHECSAIGFDYGQDHLIELDYAEKIAAHFAVPFHRQWIIPELPLVDDVVFAGRNLVLVAHALSHAQAAKFEAVAFGSNQSDWERFPDCRPAFWKAIQAAAEAYNVLVLTPLLYSWKAEIGRTARALGVPIEQTWSCYSPRLGESCGECLACKMRMEALA